MYSRSCRIRITDSSNGVQRRRGSDVRLGGDKRHGNAARSEYRHNSDFCNGGACIALDERLYAPDNTQPTRSEQ